MHLYHMTTSANVLDAKKFYFVGKQAGIIAYQVRISCKGPLSVAFFFVTSKTNVMYFKQHSWLFTL